MTAQTTTITSSSTTVRNRTFEFTADVRTMVLGYNEERDVFVAADTSLRHARFGDSSSIYTSEASLDEAQAHGISAHVSRRPEVLITVRTDMLVSYFAAGPAMHKVAATPEGIASIQSWASDDSAPAPPAGRAPRRRERVEVNRAIRSSSFRPRVVAAYGNACAICGLQLGLVEAAHIVPVTDILSDDDTDNGIALCSLHHRAYDVGLILIHPDYRVEVNEMRMRALTRSGLAANEEGFRSNLPQQIALPQNPAHYPSTENLRTEVTRRRNLPLPKV